MNLFFSLSKICRTVQISESLYDTYPLIKKKVVKKQVKITCITTLSLAPRPIEKFEICIYTTRNIQNPRNASSQRARLPPPYKKTDYQLFESYKHSYLVIIYRLFDTYFTIRFFIKVFKFFLVSLSINKKYPKGIVNNSYPKITSTKRIKVDS